MIKKSWKIGVGILAAGLCAGLLLAPRLLSPPEQAIFPMERPRLVGTWFVRYASDPKAYLDIAFAKSDLGGIQSVLAELQGPSRSYRDIVLTYNPKDEEWQKVCDFLPENLEGGIWWVRSVRTKMRDGGSVRFFSDAPHLDYQYQLRNPSGELLAEGKTRVSAGSFYVTEQGDPIYYIQTFPSKDGSDVDTILQVFSTADPVGFIAVNDDPDVSVAFGRIAMPVEPGQSYYLRVTGPENRGHYAIALSNSGFSGVSTKKAEYPDRYEPDDDFHRATRLVLGEVQDHSLSAAPGNEEDEDWFVFSVPPSGAKAAIP